jgi:hypothetical protein
VPLLTAAASSWANVIIDTGDDAAIGLACIGQGVVADERRPACGRGLQGAGEGTPRLQKREILMREANANGSPSSANSGSGYAVVMLSQLSICHLARPVSRPRPPFRNSSEIAQRSRSLTAKNHHHLHVQVIQRVTMPRSASTTRRITAQSGAPDA